MEITITAVVSFLGTLTGFLFSFAIYKRNLRQDVTTEAKSDAIVLTEIGYIKSGIDDIKRKQEIEDARYIELAERLSRLEARVDEFHTMYRAET